jgi:hypothetical protein
MLTTILLTVVFLPAQPAAWPMDELTLANGAKLQGLLVDESKAGIRFRVIRRPVGRPTVTLTSFFPPAEVRSVKRLEATERKTLLEKLAELDATTTGERKRAEELKLTPSRRFDRPVLRYDSDQFVLSSTASEEITRRTAIRLEQIFTAYQRYFPPRVKDPKTTAIYLAVDREDYDHAAYQALKITGLAGLLPQTAFFDPMSNTVVCGTELRQLGADLTAARIHHVQQLSDVTRYEQRIADLYKNAPKAERDRHLKTAADERAKVLAADRRNDASFDEATAKLFGRLYHEAFHAYVHNHVYPELITAQVKAGQGTGALPRWLNEGLAQVFETAILDGYELRVGHADAARLEKVQSSLRGVKDNAKLVPLEEMLRSVESQYLPTAPKETAAVEMRYLTAWAIAYHLTFERRVVGSKAFDDYLIAINSGTAPLTAFEKFIGQDLATYEAEFRNYLGRLRPDGSVRK